MSGEFENLVISKLTQLDNGLKEFKKTVMDRFDSVDKRLDNVDKRLDKVEIKLEENTDKIVKLEKELHNVKIKVEQNTDKIEQVEKQLVIMTNNVAIILTNTTRNHKEIIKRLDQYERKNELEHSRLNYEICKLKANA